MWFQRDHIFFCDPVIIESICYRTWAKRLINEGNTNGGLRKNWSGSTSTNLNWSTRMALVETAIGKEEDPPSTAWSILHRREKPNDDANYTHYMRNLKGGANRDRQGESSSLPYNQETGPKSDIKKKSEQANYFCILGEDMIIFITSKIPASDRH